MNLLSTITIIGTIISFMVGLWKWIDQRKREQEQRNYEAFHKMVRLASGSDENGKTLAMVQQIAAIYQLQLYKQYSFASVPVLKLMKYEYTKMHEQSPDERRKFLFEAIDKTIEQLSH